VGVSSSDMARRELHTFLRLRGCATCPPSEGRWTGILGRGHERVECVPKHPVGDARRIASARAVPIAIACAPCDSDGRVTGGTASRGHRRPKGYATTGVAILDPDATGDRAAITGSSGGEIPGACRVGTP